jgi:hypothetical protein
MLGVIGVVLTLVAYLLPSLPSAFYWRLRKAFNPAPVVTQINCHETEVLEGQPVLLSAISEDDDLSTLRYEWKPSLGRIEGVGREVKLDTTGIKPQTDKIKVEVSVKTIDSYGQTATKKTHVYVTTPMLLNKPPSIEGIKPTPLEVPAGESVALEAIATDLNNDQLKYTWHTSAGHILGDGKWVTLNTTGLAPQSNTPITATVTLKVEDGRSDPVFGRVQVNIHQKQAAKAAPSALPSPAPLNQWPRLASLVAEKSPVSAGDHVTVEATAIDEDNDKLVYHWEVPGLGLYVVNSNPSFTFKTSDIKPPPAGVSVQINLKVSDKRGRSAAGWTKVTVQPSAAPLPTPEQTPRPTPTATGSSSQSLR